MTREDEARAARAEARRDRIVLRKTTLGNEVDLHPIRGADAIALAAQLSLSAWTLSGGAVPPPRRGDVRVCFVRRPA